ncbi:MAG: hypothetical protein P8013_15315 [Candidatus Sulfobium sp.]
MRSTVGFTFRIAFTVVNALGADVGRGMSACRGLFYAAVLNARTVVYLAGDGITDTYLIALASVGLALLPCGKGQKRYK